MSNKYLEKIAQMEKEAGIKGFRANRQGLREMLMIEAKGKGMRADRSTIAKGMASIRQKAKGQNVKMHPSYAKDMASAYHKGGAKKVQRTMKWKHGKTQRELERKGIL